MCISEIIAKYMGRVYRNNIEVYNTYTLLEMSFIFYAFHHFLKEYIKIKKIILANYILILIIYFTHIFIYGYKAYNAVTVSVMSVFFVIYALLYFYLLLKDEKYIDLKFHPAFWWVGGTLIFYFGSTLANFFDDIIQTKILGNLNPRLLIYTTLNFFLYGFWSYSFICRARQRKSYL
ncbi:MULTISPECIES: hypothetical protein [unclassified Pedobacter]|uniref:hypothetical protein n=1 Tax=unclassified Pedobacter TaxID=2628915 RepID=UPI001E427C71|nr:MULTISPECIES: hypothetical protein [unclassified Pedobacter]